jgi:hypothetical protein
MYRISALALFSAIACQIFVLTVHAGETDIKRLDLVGQVQTLVQRETGEEKESNALISIHWFDRRGNEVGVYSGGAVRGTVSAGGLIGAPIYDAKGNKISEVGYNRDGSIFEKRLYAYDSHGHRVAEANYDEMGNFTKILPKGSLLNLELRYKYDEQGRVLEMLTYNWLYRSLEKIIYTYDSYGRKTEVIYSKEGVMKNSYLYDAEDQVTQIIAERDGSLVSKTIFKYDSRGNETETSRFRPDGFLEQKIKTFYEYDSKGNWIKRAWIWLIKDGKKISEPQSITIREITYY